MKYKENLILNEILEYIKSTYSEHYSSNGFQLQDAFSELGIQEQFAQASALKYLYRYGKKQGKNKTDLYKAVHYICMLLSPTVSKNGRAVK